MCTPIETDVCAETTDPVINMHAATKAVLLSVVMR
jgi:hypothetical protein